MPRAALRESADLARHCEALGYRRYWLAEHHNMPGIASAATAVAIGHVAAATSTIRVGAGGIMLPNHAPLVIAEQFGTLAALFPGRIDLGIGRAPGTDPRTALALRRHLANRSRQLSRAMFRNCSPISRPPQPGVRPCAPFPAKAAKCRYGFWAPAIMARSWRRRWGCLTPSPRISRPTIWMSPSSFTAARSSPRPGWKNPM